ncbi:DUF3885 domain-containing protein [Sporosarcina sp. Sa3CUA8]|uniref:DUF3885 domain-containing protein n=2 Tax=Sporosarcina gallistercoris TaxID=2762245 RepID=A0ABR8PK57_9BACL|nr:DUF3885 domain-containing protein [Sporosarcina gallistercoris]
MQAPLFLRWETALRFELTEPGVTMDSPNGLKQAIQRSVALFDEVFGDEDDLLVVAEVYTKKNHNFFEKRPLSTYRTFVKSQEVLDHLRHELVTEPRSAEGEEMITHRFLQPCRKQDLRYSLMLETKLFEQERMPITGLKKQPNSRFELYYLNQNRHIIFHVFSERGCDIIATDRNEIRPLYEKYNEWIEKAHRSMIDARFTEPSTGF